jgi:hypothetical protein
MKSPVVLRGEYHRTVTSLFAELDLLRKRIKDLERQFAVEYDDTGKVTKTLADVPIPERGNVKVIKKPRNPMAGMTWDQRRRWLEMTDGGRIKNG